MDLRSVGMTGVALFPQTTLLFGHFAERTPNEFAATFNY